ncbi:hypothetical protein Tco_0495381, partial [Tanacetum coccineum]
MDEEALKEMLEEEAMNKKEQEEKIRLLVRLLLRKKNEFGVV